MHYDVYMEKALKEAEKALKKGEVPVGAVLIGPDEKILATAHNQPISMKDPTAHAEILVLRSAGNRVGNYRLTGTTLVVTMEPCPMCLGAALHARISRLVFGAFDPKWGAVGSLCNLADDDRLNHRIEVVSGILEEPCARLIRDFFQNRRK
jgi:tRNA(adenine34) deaminase